MSHHAVRVGEDFYLRAYGQIRHAQVMAERQRRHVHGNGFRDVVRKTLHFHLAQHELEDSPLDLHALGFTGHMDGNLQFQLGVEGDAYQVHV